jgi:hypothetical protein
MVCQGVSFSPNSCKRTRDETIASRRPVCVKLFLNGVKFLLVVMKLPIAIVKIVYLGL